MEKQGVIREGVTPVVREPSSCKCGSACSCMCKAAEEPSPSKGCASCSCMRKDVDMSAYDKKMDRLADDSIKRLGNIIAATSSF